MRPKIFIPVLLSFLFLLIYCNHNPTQPELAPQPGARNYVWQLDTLDMPMNYISSVWGASPDDVWAVGGAGTERDRLLHYDGKAWSTYTKEAIQCGGFSLFGFSPDNVWMGGQAGWFAHGAAIWHYNGVEWKQNFVYDIEGSHNITVEDIWGSAPNDIFACGVINFYDGKTDVWRGYVLHFDGKVWREVVRAQFDSQFYSVRIEQKKAYVLSYGPGGGDVEFYEVKGNTLKKISSNKRSQIRWANLSVMDEKCYFVIGQDIFRYINERFIKIFTIEQDEFGNQIFGRNENDFFLLMFNGVAHFNGTDVEYLYHFSPPSINLMKNAVVFEREVFFCGRSRLDLSNVVLHGKLN